MKQFLMPLLAGFFLVSCGGKFDVNQEGGLVMTLETSPGDFLVRTSGYSRNPVFLKALEETYQSREANGIGFITSFIEKMYASGPNPAAIFAAGDPQEYKHTMSKDELKKKLLNEYIKATDRSRMVILTRLNKFGISKLNLYKDKEGRIVIEIGDEIDLNRVRRIVTSTAELNFYETYENSDSYKYLETANKTLSQLMYPGIDSLKEPVDKDSLQEFQYMKYPLYKYLQLSLQQDHGKNSYYFEKGCRIGMAKMSDTAVINSMLRREQVRALFPRELFFAWAMKPEKDENMRNFISLYILKARNGYSPALPGNVITDAHADEDESGRIVINMNMSSEGADQWNEVTSKNIDKSIAIVLDGHVASAPIVSGVITNGTSTISGNFAVDEAEDLANMLKAGTMPVKVRIIEEKRIPKK